MPKVWTDDTALMEGMTDNLFEALYKMPKYFLRIDDIAHSLEMPISSLLVLCVLREGKISIGEISERLCIAKPNVTPLVETLCARGLISRQRSDKDRRKVLVGLMPEGEAMVERIRGAIRDQMMSWPRDYNLSEMKRVNNALAATLEVADDVMRRRRWGSQKYQVVSDGQTMPKTRTGTSASRTGHAGSFHVDFFTANLPPRGRTAPSARRSALMRESAPRTAADSQT